MAKKLFKKGESGNPNGRPKGSPNVLTAEIKQLYLEILHGNRDKIIEDLEKMGPFQRQMTIDRLNKYIVPTLSQSKVEGEVTGDITIKVVYENQIDKDTGYIKEDNIEDE